MHLLLSFAVSRSRKLLQWLSSYFMVKATSSSSVPLRMSEDANTAFNSHVSRTSTVGGNKWSDVSLHPNLQANDRIQSEGDSPLGTDCGLSELADRGTTIHDLPDDLMLEIFSYMSFSENINILQEVCTRWKILAQNAHLWLHKTFIVSYYTSEEEAVATFATVPQLRSVILEKPVSQPVLVALSRSCPHLTTLTIDAQQQLTHSEADSLFNGCKKICSLTMAYDSFRVDVRLADAVARLSDLRVLHLSELGGRPPQIPLRVLADGCPHLCDLELGGGYPGICYWIRDAEYFLSSHKRVLEILGVRWMSSELRCIVPLLARVETLRSLTLRYTDEDRCPEGVAEGLTALGRLHNLRQLCIGVFRLQHLVPAVFQKGGLSKLQKLELYSTVTDEVTRAVAVHCPDLRELELSDCRGHTDTLFEPLCQLERLERLKIHQCKCLRGKAMSHIAKLPALHTLEFIFIKFDKLKPSIDCILEMAELRRLYLSGSICFAIPFDKFPGRLVNLRELVIDYCDGDQEVLDRLCAQMPDLKVEGSLGAWITDDEDDDW